MTDDPKNAEAAAGRSGGLTDLLQARRIAVVRLARASKGVAG